MNDERSYTESRLLEVVETLSKLREYVGELRANKTLMENPNSEVYQMARGASMCALESLREAYDLYKEQLPEETPRREAARLSGLDLDFIEEELEK